MRACGHELIARAIPDALYFDLGISQISYCDKISYMAYITKIGGTFYEYYHSCPSSG